MGGRVGLRNPVSHYPLLTSPPPPPTWCNKYWTAVGQAIRHNASAHYTGNITARLADWTQTFFRDTQAGKVSALSMVKFLLYVVL